MKIQRGEPMDGDEVVVALRIQTEDGQIVEQVVGTLTMVVWPRETGEVYRIEVRELKPPGEG